MLSSGRFLVSLAPRWAKKGLANLREVCEDVLHLTLIDALNGAERAVQFLFRGLGRIIRCVALQEVRESLQETCVVLLRSTIYYL